VFKIPLPRRGGRRRRTGWLIGNTKCHLTSQPPNHPALRAPLQRRGIRNPTTPPKLANSPKVVSARSETTKQSIRTPTQAPKQPNSPYGLPRPAALAMTTGGASGHKIPLPWRGGRRRRTGWLMRNTKRLHFERRPPTTPPFGHPSRGGEVHRSPLPPAGEGLGERVGRTNLSDMKPPILRRFAPEKTTPSPGLRPPSPARRERGHSPGSPPTPPIPPDPSLRGVKRRSNPYETQPKRRSNPTLRMDCRVAQPEQ
jgi:hypothetical protein